VVLFDQFWGMYLCCRFPHVVALWVAFPFEEVFQLFHASTVLVALNGLDFVLFFASDEVGWWSRIIGAMLFCFYIWG
jgi:hypothetical protein